MRDRGVPGGQKDSFPFSGKSQTDTYHIFILRSEVSSIEEYDAPTNVFFYLPFVISLSLQFSCFSLSFLFLLFFGLWFQ